MFDAATLQVVSSKCCSGCCSEWRCVAVCCTSSRQCVTTRCNALQGTHCLTLQLAMLFLCRCFDTSKSRQWPIRDTPRVALCKTTSCSVLQTTANILHAAHCNVKGALPCARHLVAVCCNTIVALCCSTLQHTHPATCGEPRFIACKTCIDSCHVYI